MSLSNQEKLKLLRTVKSFDGMTDMEIDLISSTVHERDYPKRQVIVNEGDPGETMFIIASGMVKITQKEGDNENMVAVLKTGDIIGEMSIFDSQPRSATVTAMEDTVLLELEKKQFVTLIAKMPEIALSMLRMMSQRLRTVTKAYTLLQQ